MIPCNGEPAIPSEVGDQLTRYGARYASRLRALAAISPRVGQIAISHPVLFFALATPYGPIEHRRRAIEFAVVGHPLAEVCAAVGIPLAMRRLPPEACREVLAPARWSADAGRQLAPLMPKTEAEAAAWLSAISFAHCACDETFALWIAAQKPLFQRRGTGRAALTVLALHAWYSMYSVLPSGDDPQGLWMADLAIETAVLRATAWVQQIKLLVDLGPEGLGDGWVGEGSLAGYRFCPITTPEALYAEARAMHNCVMSYSTKLASDECRLVSMTENGRHVATIELRRGRGSKALAIEQIKGPLNTEVAPAVTQIAAEWLAAHAGQGPVLADPGRATTAQRLCALLAPWQAQRTDLRRWRPHVPMSEMRLGLLELGLRTGVRLMVSRWEW